MEFVLDQREIRLGRGPGVDLAIDDGTLEREHAVIEFSDGAYHVRSTHDTAETQVNGTPVARHSLKPEDRLQLGQVEFTYVIEARSAASSG